MRLLPAWEAKRAGKEQASSSKGVSLCSEL